MRAERSFARVVTTAFDDAQRWIGLRELPGEGSDPFVLGMLRLDASWPESDEVPWCSAFVNFVARQLRLPRSKSLRARSWLEVGQPVALEDALVGFDVAIFWRGSRKAQGLGHVGFYAGTDGDEVLVLGGNQADAVSVAPYSRRRLMGIRRLLPEPLPPWTA